jgi:carboxypeptidase Taq
LNKNIRPFDELFEFNKITLALKKVIERNSWDQEAIMPTGALEDRAEEQASLMIIAHKRQTSGEFSDLLNSIEPEKLSKIELRQFRLMKKDFTRAVKVPTDLVGALAKETTLAHSVWVNSRKNNSFQQFLPYFSKVLELRKEEADAIRQGSGLTRYDTLLQDYEPDVKSDYIDKIFNSLRPALVDLRSRVLDQPPAQEITGFFPIRQAKAVM